MKIKEITEGLEEALAGTTQPGGIKGWFSSTTRATKQMQRAIENRAKQFVPRWHARYAQLEASGVKMDGSTPESKKNYIDNLLKFASGKIPNLFDDPQGQKIAQDLKTAVNTDNFKTEKQLQDFLVKTIAHAQTLKSQSSSTPPGTPPATVGKKVPAVRTGTKAKASNSITYRLVRLRDKSREWHDLGGNIAPDEIQQELNTKYGL